jgi:hypothetical protein
VATLVTLTTHTVQDGLTAHHRHILSAGPSRARCGTSAILAETQVQQVRSGSVQGDDGLLWNVGAHWKQHTEMQQPSYVGELLGVASVVSALRFAAAKSVAAAAEDCWCWQHPCHANRHLINLLP